MTDNRVFPLLNFLSVFCCYPTEFHPVALGNLMFGKIGNLPLIAQRKHANTYEWDRLINPRVSIQVSLEETWYVCTVGQRYPPIPENRAMTEKWVHPYIYKSQYDESLRKDNNISTKVVGQMKYFCSVPEGNLENKNTKLVENFATAPGDDSLYRKISSG